MPSLAEHLVEGNFFEPGDHEVTVASYRLFSSKSGTEGVEFILTGERGKQTRASFYLTEKALRRLAWFAEACGLSKDDMRTYNTDTPGSHEQLLGKRVLVTIEKVSAQNGKEYSEVVAWRKSENGMSPAPAPAAQKPTPPAPTQPNAFDGLDDSKTKDDLLF